MPKSTSTAQAEAFAEANAEEEAGVLRSELHVWGFYQHLIDIGTKNKNGRPG